MTRVIVYSAALVALIAATATTISSILSPNWISYTVHSPTGTGTITRTVGLHKSCTTTSSSPSSSSSSSICNPFPDPSSPIAPIWRTASFLLAVALVLELAALVGFVVVLSRGKAARETGSGWKVLGSMLATVCAALVAALSAVAYVFDHDDDMFAVPGWRLDRGFALCVVGAVAAGLAGLGLVGSRVLLGAEDGYEVLGERMRAGGDGDGV